MSGNSNSCFVAGLDLGQAADYTALVILELVDQGEQPVIYHARYVSRYPLKTEYPDIVQHVKELLSQPETRGRCLVVTDATGVGRPVVDLLWAAGVPCVAVHITGSGNTVTRDNTVTRGEWYNVPKRDLVINALVLLQTGRLEFAGELPLGSILKNELGSYELKVSPLTAHDSYNARAGAHDDLVLAVALAAWYPEYKAAQPVIRQEIIYRPVQIGPRW